MTFSHDMSGYHDSELSDTWLKLLGTASTELDASGYSGDDGNNGHSGGGATSDGNESPMPVTADPWSELLRSQGVEVVDLQQSSSYMVHVSFSEQEVEQALQIMQEQ